MAKIKRLLDRNKKKEENLFMTDVSEMCNRFLAKDPDNQVLVHEILYEALKINHPEYPKYMIEFTIESWFDTVPCAALIDGKLVPIDRDRISYRKSMEY